MKILFAIVAGALILCGAGGWYWYSHSAPAVVYRTAEITRGDMVPTISATGTVEPQEVVDVGAQVEGQILSFGIDKQNLMIDYGSQVEAGTVLARIDEQLYADDEATAEANVAQAEAAVNSAKATLDQMNAKSEQAASDWERAQKLYPSEALATSDYNTYKSAYGTAVANVAVANAAIHQAEAAVLQQQAALRKAKKNLEYCTITSPVKGVVIDRRVNIGETVVSSLNTPSLFLIAKDLTQIQVWVSVNEADIGNIHPGQRVTFTVDSYPGESFKGEVGKIRLNASMTQNVVTYTVEVNTDNSDSRLLPYLTANAQFEITRKANVLLVPNAALRWYPQPEMVDPEVRKAMTAEKESHQHAGNADAGASGDKSGDGSKSGDMAAHEGDHPHHGKVGASTRPSTRPAKAEPHGHGTIWVMDGKYVKPIKVRTSATDGISTEISMKNDELKEGQVVITGEQHVIADAGGTNNPFAPQPIFGRRGH